MMRSILADCFLRAAMFLNWLSEKTKNGAIRILMLGKRKVRR